MVVFFQIICYTLTMSSLMLRKNASSRKCTGLGLIPEKPCDTGFHEEGATSKSSGKAFCVDE